VSRRHLTLLDPAPPHRFAEQHEHVCATCGRVHAPDARFCSNCGAPLDAFDSFFGESHSDEDTILAPARNTAVTAAYAVRPQVAARPVRSGALRADPSACGLLSFFFPGAGQMLAGQWVKGAFLITLAWIAVRGFHLDAFGLLMLAGRVLCAADASGIARRRQKGRAVAEWDWAISNKPETR
jgi:hypothetical protein